MSAAAVLTVPRSSVKKAGVSWVTRQMVAGPGYRGAGSGVQAGLGLELLEAVDEPLDVVVVGEQLAGAGIVAAEDATQDGVEEEHAQPVEGASPTVGLQEEDGRYGRAPQLDLSATASTSSPS